MPAVRRAKFGLGFVIFRIEYSSVGGIAEPDSSRLIPGRINSFSFEIWELLISVRDMISHHTIRISAVLPVAPAYINFAERCTTMFD